MGVDIDYNDTVKELDDIKSLRRIIRDEDLICRDVKEYIGKFLFKYNHNNIYLKQFICERDNQNCLPVFYFVLYLIRSIV